MKRRVLRILFLVLTILGIAVLVIGGISVLSAVLHSRASIGIIGGADGPTAIFVASRSGFLDLAAASVLLIAVGLIGFLCLRGRRNGKQ